jgi:hypothetical protein
MSAAFFRIDIIDIGKDVLIVGIGILQGHFNNVAISFSLDIDWLLVNGGLAAINIIYKGNNAAFVVENLALFSAFVSKLDFYSLV